MACCLNNNIIPSHLLHDCLHCPLVRINVLSISRLYHSIMQQQNKYVAFHHLCQQCHLPPSDIHDCVHDREENNPMLRHVHCNLHAPFPIGVRLNTAPIFSIENFVTVVVLYS